MVGVFYFCVFQQLEYSILTYASLSYDLMSVGSLWWICARS